MSRKEPHEQHSELVNTQRFWHPNSKSWRVSQDDHFTAYHEFAFSEDFFKMPFYPDNKINISTN